MYRMALHLLVCCTVQVDVNKVWITFSSIILAFSFVFSKSIGDMYAAVIFLFVVHPFDVGDALMIGSNLTGSALNQLVWVSPPTPRACVPQCAPACTGGLYWQTPGWSSATALCALMQQHHSHNILT